MGCRWIGKRACALRRAASEKKRRREEVSLRVRNESHASWNGKWNVPNVWLRASHSAVGARRNFIEEIGRHEISSQGH